MLHTFKYHDGCTLSEHQSFPVSGERSTGIGGHHAHCLPRCRSAANASGSMGSTRQSRGRRARPPARRPTGGAGSGRSHRAADGCLRTEGHRSLRPDRRRLPRGRRRPERLDGRPGLGAGLSELLDGLRAEEDAARIARLGIWRGDFTAPWDWRHGQRTPTVEERTTPPESAAACCRVCTTGKACGNSCISRSKTCRKPSGCACDAQ
jgi:hypothetical protein